MTAPFIVYGTPRSRTAWLAEFLSYRGWTCHHEAAIYMRSIDDVVALFRRRKTGCAETAAGYGWPVLHHHVPDIKAVVVRRPVGEIVDAFMRLDVSDVGTYDPAKLATVMARASRDLVRISQQPGVLSVDYVDLDREDICAAVFEHCLPFKFDKQWWNDLRQKNIQADVKGVLRYYYANKDAVDGFKRTCKTELRRLAYAGMIRHHKGA